MDFIANRGQRQRAFCSSLERFGQLLSSGFFPSPQFAGPLFVSDNKDDTNNHVQQNERGEGGEEFSAQRVWGQGNVGILIAQDFARTAGALVHFARDRELALELRIAGELRLEG